MTRATFIAALCVLCTVNLVLLCAGFQDSPRFVGCVENAIAGHAAPCLWLGFHVPAWCQRLAVLWPSHPPIVDATVAVLAELGVVAIVVGTRARSPQPVDPA